MSTEGTTYDEAQAALRVFQEKDKENAHVLVEYIKGLNAMKKVALDDDEMFAVKTKEGRIRGFKRFVTLKQADGEIVKLAGKIRTVTAAGYKKLAEKMGMHVLNAPSVIVDGQEQHNPHVTRDPVRGEVTLVSCRSIAFTYNDHGVPSVSDRTATLDVKAYQMQDLISKAGQYPQAFKLLPKGVSPSKAKVMYQGERDREERALDGTWACYDFDEASNLWVLTSHPEVLAFHKSFTNRRKKLVEFVQTFAQRNAIKNHPSVPNIPLLPDDEGNVPTEVTVPVYAHYAVEGVIRFDGSAYEHVRSLIDSAAKGDGKALDGEVEVIKGAEDVLEDKEARKELEDLAAREDAKAGIPIVEEAEFTVPEGESPFGKPEYEEEERRDDQGSDGSEPEGEEPPF